MLVSFNYNTFYVLIYFFIYIIILHQIPKTPDAFERPIKTVPSEHRLCNVISVTSRGRLVFDALVTKAQ